VEVHQLDVDTSSATVGYHRRAAVEAALRQQEPAPREPVMQDEVSATQLEYVTGSGHEICQPRVALTIVAAVARSHGEPVETRIMID
jgi:hypothetical protein